MKQKINTEQQVRLPKQLLIKAQARARALGLTLAEYVKVLVDKDVQTKEHDPWLDPVPKEVDERWEREIAEFDEQEKVNPRPGARTADELMKLLDQETAHLPDDEGN